MARSPQPWKSCRRDVGVSGFTLLTSFASLHINLQLETRNLQPLLAKHRVDFLLDLADRSLTGETDP